MAQSNIEEQENTASCLQDGFFEEVSLTAPSATLQRRSHISPQAARASIDDFYQEESNEQSDFTETFRLPQPTTQNILSSETSYPMNTPSPPPSTISTFQVYHNTVREEDFTEKPRRTSKIRLQNLFKGTSAPVQLGFFPTRSQEDTDEVVDRMPYSKNANKRPSMARLSSTRTSWFAPKANIEQRRNTAEDPHDELLNLNIQDALFPHGPVDPLDPTSFNDLLFNAESLIYRLQTAYREEKKHFENFVAERSVQDDEVEEAKVRARHLKLQLDDMAAKASEQDATARALGEELAREKLRREEEEDARKRSVMIVQNANSSYRLNEKMEKLTQRVTVNANNTDDDDGDDSDDESLVESVFSHGDRAISPVRSVTTACSEVESPTHAVQLEYPAQSLQIRPSHMQRQSTFERVLGEISGKKNCGNNHPMTGALKGLGVPNEHACANLNDNERRRLYASIDELEEDNSSLRARVAQLETAVDSCLSLVHV